MHFLIPALLMAMPASDTTRSLPPSHCLMPEAMRSAATENRLQPLNRVVGVVKRNATGELLAARLCETEGNWVYMVHMLGKDGRVQRILVDAKTAQIISTR